MQAAVAIMEGGFFGAKVVLDISHSYGVYWKLSGRLGIFFIAPSNRVTERETVCAPGWWIKQGRERLENRFVGEMPQMGGEQQSLVVGF